MKNKYTHAIVILNEYDSFISGSIIIIVVDKRGNTYGETFEHDEINEFFVQGNFNQTGIKEYIKEYYKTDNVYFYSVVNGYIEE